ncbi:MAG: apolipoprotein N-acyltransferase [Hydrogenovibrio sp.]
MMIAFVLGALMVFAHAPVGIAPLALIALGGLFWLWQQADTSFRAMQIGLSFGLGYFGFGVSWLISSIYLYAEMNLLLSVLAVLCFILFLTLYFILAGWLVARLKTVEHLGFNWVVVMPAVWVFAEWLRATLFGGFPFLMTGNTHLITWLDGYAPVFGVTGVSWAVAMSAGILLWLLQSRAWVGASLSLAVIWLGAASLKNIEWVQPVGKPVEMALIQGNVPQDEKWLPSAFLPTLKRYVSLTKDNLKADIIVWPETAIPAYYDVVEKGALRSFIRDAQLLNADILMGVITRDPDHQRYYNAIVNAHNPEQEYRKQHLVPFSEFFPFSGVLQPLSALFNVPFSEFSAGAADQPPMTFGAHTVGLSVCYEMAFGAELIESARRSDFLITVSNDAWFAHTLEPAQQVQDVQMRALELGREIARSTSTGYTVIVDTKGQIKAEIPAYEVGVLRDDVQPYQGETPFVRWGSWPILAGLFTVMLLLVARRIWEQRRVKTGLGNPRSTRPG